MITPAVYCLKANQIVTKVNMPIAVVTTPIHREFNQPDKEIKVINDPRPIKTNFTLVLNWSLSSASLKWLTQPSEVRIKILVKRNRLTIMAQVEINSERMIAFERRSVPFLVTKLLSMVALNPARKVQINMIWVDIVCKIEKSNIVSWALCQINIRIFVILYFSCKCNGSLL